MTEGVFGLMRDKTRPSRIPPLGTEVEQHVVARTLKDPPGETTHWTAAAMAKETGISVSSVTAHLAQARPAAASDASIQAVQ